ncbi:hypothetical protein RHMOL_Rhmol06G0277300 [Rhododendron molle]|uniref:Uncharacterized protein n=1 Tax=Rhododendron molle TaxID=49168 RepID=A0ACC0NHU4_RHOML|nr:hypothetical protein RHMOL_Rhmol06G0277300 [Rhododendron molle]
MEDSRNHVGRAPMRWDDENEWFNLHSKGGSMRKCVLKLSLPTAIYYIWRGRNARIFQHKRLDPGSLAATVCNSVRDALLSWRLLNSSQGNKDICREWSIL